jgi:hypothetical protein
MNMTKNFGLKTFYLQKNVFKVLRYAIAKFDKAHIPILFWVSGTDRFSCPGALNFDVTQSETLPRRTTQKKIGMKKRFKLFILFKSNYYAPKKYQSHRTKTEKTGFRLIILFKSNHEASCGLKLVNAPGVKLKLSKD